MTTISELFDTDMKYKRSFPVWVWTRGNLYDREVHYSSPLFWGKRMWREITEGHLVTMTDCPIVGLGRGIYVPYGGELVSHVRKTERLVFSIPQTKYNFGLFTSSDGRWCIEGDLNLLFSDEEKYLMSRHPGYREGVSRYWEGLSSLSD